MSYQVVCDRCHKAETPAGQSATLRWAGETALPEGWLAMPVPRPDGYLGSVELCAECKSALYLWLAKPLGEVAP